MWHLEFPQMKADVVVVASLRVPTEGPWIWNQSARGESRQTDWKLWLPTKDRFRWANVTSYQKLAVLFVHNIGRVCSFFAIL